ncbi:hypothetical protein [Orbus hercynius]|uniref:hypothetical protein n=1 Tax=Orbus hercynius TaxID=593135 RepID=UPI000EB2D19C|nr:hypothetical protein [Orbus hercynius]
MLKQKSALRSTVLQIPHHGSNTSSYYAFLSNVNPQVSLGSVSRYNPWNLPSKKALHRYHDLNFNYYLTSLSGQISVLFYTDDWRVNSMRGEIKPRWYHDWFGALPNYG